MNTKKIKSQLVSVSITMLLLSGCGKYGYKSEYTAQIDSKTPVKVAELYYAAVNKNIDSAKEVSGKLAQAAIQVGQQIGKPLAPPEAVHPRTKMAISGTGKKFDIIDSLPPEKLLPLAQERTKQVYAVANAISRTAEMATISIAAPADYVMQQEPNQSITGLLEWPSVLNNLPNADDNENNTQPAEEPEDKGIQEKFEDIRSEALDVLRKKNGD